MPTPSERSGSFATQDPVSLLRELAEERFSGSVRSEHDGLVKVLYLFEGQLACASSTDPRDRLGPLLRDSGQITAQQLELAEDKAVAGEALGSVLVNLGFIGPAGLMWGARRQVEQVVQSLLLWPRGTFRCREASLPERAVNLKLGVPSVVMGAVKMLEDRDEVTSRLVSLDASLKQAPAATYPDPEDADGHALWDMLDGERPLRVVCAESTLDDFDAAKILLGLQLLGLAKRVKTAGSRPDRPGLAPVPLSGDRPSVGVEESRSGPAGLAGTVDGGELESWEEATAAAVDEVLPIGAGSTPDLPVPSGIPLPDDSRSGQPGQEDALETMPPASSILADPLEPAATFRPADAFEPEEDSLEAAPPAGHLEEGLPFDEPGDPEPFVDDDDKEDDMTEWDEDETPPMAAGSGGSRRTLWIGGALVVVAATVVYFLIGGQDPAPTLDTTGGGPSGVLPGAPPSTGLPPAEDDPTAADGSDPQEVAEPDTLATEPGGTSPPGGPATPPPASSPATVETPPVSPKLRTGGTTEAAVDAFQNDDFSGAAALWARQLAGPAPDHHTIQVLVACQESTLVRLRKQLGSSDELVVLPVRVDGEGCYRVGWGLYPSRAAADAALQDVPGYFTAGGQRPLPIPLARVVP